MEQQPIGTTIHRKSSRWTLSILSAIGLIMTVAIFSILGAKGGHCDIPLREWLFIFSGTLGLISVTSMIVETCLIKCLSYRTGFYSYNIAMGFGITFLFIWLSIGSYFILSSSTCRDNFKVGYDLTLSIFGVFFLISALMIGLLLAGIFSGFFDKRKSNQFLNG
ncbi:unnamed protein product [Blepharisma stoltei]|uniref:MARVEL domain-containing protein n=1 Tax=Blepharisma stoltei TaxID=1481888 RepID=A0AAU9IDU6_9CILI|nr:unnamed protein product [Blepharisma stoltei]